MRGGAMRRRALLSLPLVAAGCGLSERPYAERRQWPLLVARPIERPAKIGGRVLEVRSFRAGPAAEARGLQTMQPDGSVRVAFYEEWAVPPAQAAEDQLRRWLASSGLFAGVVSAGTRAVADYVLEGELVALWTRPEERRAHAGLAITVIGQRGEVARGALQRSFSAETELSGEDAGAQVRGLTLAMTGLFAQIEGALAGVG